MKSNVRLLLVAAGLSFAAASFAQKAAAPAPMPAASSPAAATAMPAEKAAPTAKAKSATAPAAATPSVAAAGGGAGKVWVNSKSKAYHCEGTKFYGKTKVGEYMTEADATAKGNHADHGKGCAPK